VTDTTATQITTWNIDTAHSSIEFAVKHMVFATAKGRFAEFSGSVNFNEENITESSVDVEIQAGSATTNQAQRDAHLRSADFFDADNHPVATFKSTSITGTPDNLKINGDLTIRGVTKPVVLDAEFLGKGVTPYGAPVAGFSAKAKINRTDFGLNYNSALETGGVLIGEDIRLSIEVELNPAQ
jgi:polyisoprenoid-binding protein YceI